MDNVKLKPKSNPNSDPKQKNKMPMLIAVVVVLVGLIAFGAWSFYNYQKASQEVVKLSSLEGQQEIARKETESLLANISKHMILPDGENPTIATVTDVEVLKKDQPFFEKAENGDKLLVYTNARKAIIYSPIRDVVVNVGALVIDQNTSNAESSSDENDQNQQEAQEEGQEESESETESEETEDDTESESEEE